MAGLTEEEFKTWCPVRAAVEVLVGRGFQKDEARQAILDGLCNDAIQSAAQRTLKLSTVGGKNDDLSFARLRSPHWLVDTPAASFWDDGTAILRKKGVANFIYRHDGVRFRPADIETLAKQR